MIPPLRVLGSDVLVLPDERTDKIGAIFLTERAQKRPRTGVVVAVGPGPRFPDGQRYDLQPQVGDRVIFYKYTARNVVYDDVTYVLVDDQDIICRYAGNVRPQFQ